MTSYTELASRLEMSQQELEAESLRVYLQYRLREIQADILSLCRRYGVQGAEDMERRYQAGALAEEGTWEDFFRLDHLQSQRDDLVALLEDL